MKLSPQLKEQLEKLLPILNINHIKFNLDSEIRIYTTESVEFNLETLVETYNCIKNLSNEFHIWLGYALMDTKIIIYNHPTHPFITIEIPADKVSPELNNLKNMNLVEGGTIYSLQIFPRA